MALPRFVALGREGKYSRYVLEEGELHSRMQLSSNEVLGERSFTKLEVIIAESFPSSEHVLFVHLRSAYNNKYLVKLSEESDWVVAGADDPEEDLSKWSCTLFRVLNANKRVRLYLLSSGVQSTVHIQQEAKCLVVGKESSSSAVVFNYTDLDSLVILPKHVAFKGDNKKYLSTRYIRRHQRLQFHRTDPLNKHNHHQSFMLPNGDYRLKSDQVNKFWRKSCPDWIYCDTSDTGSGNRDTIFGPVKLDGEGKSVALKNLGNGKYCRRHTAGGQPRLKDTLRATSSSVIREATLTVEEAVKDRDIYDVLYRIEDARIYDRGLASNVIQTTSNFSESNTTEKQLGFTYTKLTQETFSSSHSFKIKTTVKIKAQLLKFVQGSIQTDITYEGSLKWSELKEETEEVSSTITVKVPPMTKTTVTMLIGRGSIDVPFSYTQRDILPDGRVVIQSLHDGLYSGVNTELIDYIIKEESLSQLLSIQEIEAARAALSLSSKL